MGTDVRAGQHAITTRGRAVAVALMAMVASLCLVAPAHAGEASVHWAPETASPATVSTLTLRTQVNSTSRTSAPSAYYEYGTTVALGSSTAPVQTAPKPPFDYVWDLEQTITGLSPNTTYFVRAVAVGTDGVASPGPIGEFMTLGPFVLTTGDLVGGFTFDAQRNLLKFRLDALVNGGGKIGRASSQASLHPDFRRTPGDFCGTEGDGSAGIIRESTDRSDHPFTDPCYLFFPPGHTGAATVYYRVTFLYDDWEGTSQDECVVQYQCVGETRTLQVPASVFGSGAPDPADVREALAKSLTPAGAAAKIGSILKKGSYAASLDAPSAGVASFVWKQTGGAASVLARGAATIDEAGKAVIKISLTSAGGTVLRQAKRAGSPVRMQALGSFTPRGGAKVSESKVVKLRG